MAMFSRDIICDNRFKWFRAWKQCFSDIVHPMEELRRNRRRRVRHEDESLPLSLFGDLLRSINYETRTISFSLFLSLSLSLSLSPPTRVRSRCDSPVTGARARRRAALRRAGTSVQQRKRGCTAAVAAAAARASTITIIYADGVSTLTFNVPPPPWGERSDRSPLASSSDRGTSRNYGSSRHN